jgi:thioredoxin reductase
MLTSSSFDVIIIGGSYAGLSAAMALGRSMRQVLIIDSGKPCNRQTPHSHNFLTQDGSTPQAISNLAKDQVMAYPGIQFLEAVATSGFKSGEGYRIETETGATFTAKKLLFATGVKDIMPQIGGFADCWGISVIHCPYCHGYEVRGQKTAILANGDVAVHMATLVSHWTNKLQLLTNGPSSLQPEQAAMLNNKGIEIIEKEISHFEHEQGQLKKVLFKDGSQLEVPVVYARVPFRQTSWIPEQFGCALTEEGLIVTDQMQKTNVPGIYAAGDNATPLRAVSQAVAAGTRAGAGINIEIISEAAAVAH